MSVVLSVAMIPAKDPKPTQNPKTNYFLEKSTAKREARAGTHRGWVGLGCMEKIDQK